MANLADSAVRAIIEPANFAVVGTLNADGTMHSTVIWISLEDGELAINSAVGRKWPSNLDRDSRVTLVVYDAQNPYEFVEIRGTARGSRDDADDHIDRLAKKYTGQDKYPFRAPGEVRMKYVISPEHVRHQAQG
jgi:PPOX class probable F420-dependent enzyme